MWSMGNADAKKYARNSNDKPNVREEPLFYGRKYSTSQSVNSISKETSAVN